MKKLTIFHFNPLEWYPPLQNILRVLESDTHFDTIRVITTRGRAELPVFLAHSKKIVIIRLGRSGAKLGLATRWFTYFYFYSYGLFSLLKERPGRVLYFETLSGWPAYIYKRFFYRSSKIYIHYHEYTTAAEYQKGMVLTRYFHALEHWLYPRAEWVSHTNPDRMSFFLRDVTPVKVAHPFILPNYPPRNWLRPPHEVHEPLRIIYIGALGMDSMFTQEFAQWVTKWRQHVIWDIYTYNSDAKAIEFIKGLQSSNISLREGIHYEKLVDIIPQYDVGVIFYKGIIMNHTYSVSNKFYEYLTCGLDVWFSTSLLSTLPYATITSYPKILPLDFNSLEEVDPRKLCSRNGLTLRQDHYFCEVALAPLIQKLTEE